MSRPFDILIYGATGFAGKHVVKHFINNHPTIKLAIGGRNQTKLTQLVTDLNASSPTTSSSDSPLINTNQILIASSDDKQQLVQILSQAKIVLACAGPYRHVGKNIVEAAIQAQTDYLDLCGEPQFFDDMLTSFDKQARESKTLVISACAFDCVPAELCYQLSTKELKKKYATADPNADVAVTNVEVVHTFQNGKCANATTFHAAVDGFHALYTGELKESREKVKSHFPQLSALNKQRTTRPEDWKQIIDMPGMTSPLYHEQTNTHILKFMGADASCILASDRYLRLRLDENNNSPAANADDETKEQQQQVSVLPPMPFLSVCFGIQEKSNAYKFLGFGAVFSTLAKWSWGCKLLHSNPELFTNGFFKEGGPSEDEMKEATFSTYGTAYGLTKEQCVKVRFSGGEPGYIATSAMLSALALTVLNHRESMKFEGGVMLPGAAFNECDEVYDILRQEGLKIDIIETNNNEDSVASANDEQV
jgi:short subunit dehydrogenase-like uncharacterized protein